LRFTNGTAGLDDIQQPAQCRVGVAIKPTRSPLVLDTHEDVARQQPVCDLRQFRGIVVRQPFKHGAPVLFPNLMQVSQQLISYALA
jgi:hypothetical protein